MKLDNFTTIKCSKCGWVKQFQPGREYNSKDFECNCNKAPKESNMDRLKKIAKNMGISFPNNIGEATLSNKIKEAQYGNKS